jgi:hypothetical protein
MARNTKSISVKIATPKVIKALETRLVELNTNYENQEANEAKYVKAMEKWRKEVAKFAIDRHLKQKTYALTIAHGTILSMLISI